MRCSERSCGRAATASQTSLPDSRGPPRRRLRRCLSDASARTPSAVQAACGTLRSRRARHSTRLRNPSSPSGESRRTSRSRPVSVARISVRLSSARPCSSTSWRRLVRPRRVSHSVSVRGAEVMITSEIASGFASEIASDSRPRAAAADGSPVGSCVATPQPTRAAAPSVRTSQQAVRRYRRAAFLTAPAPRPRAGNYRTSGNP